MLSPRIKWLLDNLSGHKILDVGFIGEDDAEMVVHDLLRKKYPERDIYGLDTNREKVEVSPWPNCVVGSLYKIPFNGEEFDTVILCEVLEHLTEILPAFKEVARVLKPGGHFYLTTPSCYGLWRWMKHWLLARNLCEIFNVRGFLGNKDHKIFWEPLSVMNSLHTCGFRIKTVTTKNLALPYFPARFGNPDLSGWPFNRMGTYLCLIAEKV